MYVIGIDIGGTKTAAGIVALPSGEILAKEVVATHAERDGEAVLADVVSIARDLQKKAAREAIKIDGIGAGIAELVDEHGNVTSGHTIRWTGLPVRERLSEIAPAVIESDVRAAALAEATLGAAKNYRLFVYVTVGTGISCCLVQDGRPFAGARGGALVFATSPLTTTCTECGVELRPVLEEIASGPALLARFNARSKKKLQRCEDVLGAAENGDPNAIKIARTGGEALGVSVAWLINTLDPEAVIVGGGLGVAGGLYWEHFLISARRHIWAEAARALPIAAASLGPDAGLIGAACAFQLRCPEELRTSRLPQEQPLVSKTKSAPAAKKVARGARR